MFDRVSHHDQRCFTDATYCSQILVINTRAGKGVDDSATFLSDAKRYPLPSTESQHTAGLREAALTCTQEVAAIAVIGGW
jgi:hypothetical protein